jgi:hypothetical protein
MSIVSSTSFRMPMRLGTIALASLLASTSLLSAQAKWSDEFDQPGLLGRAYTVTTYQGDLIMGGPGSQADGHFFGFTARFDGTHWQPMGKDIWSDSGNPYVRHHVGVYTEYQGDLIAGGHFTGAGGVVNFSPDLASGLPGGLTINPGDTWNFTLWYRDGAQSNFSDAVSIQFN